MVLLVTGSSGHLGEALMRSLRAAQRPARGIDLKPSEFTDGVGSICDRAFMQRSLRGVQAVIHAATLHKPHVATHSWQDFIDTNITGTLTLLEEAAAAGVDRLVYASTTSVFGAALTPAPGAPAVWVTEDLVPAPRNIYGASKATAESLCEIFHRKRRLPVVVLRIARFFPEADDDAAIRERHSIQNVQANEMLYRRVDLEDVVDACLRALSRAPGLGFARYVISATTPFAPADLAQLRSDAPAVVRRLFPECDSLYAARHWRLFPQLSRVYVNERARAELDWRPRHDFNHVLDCLRGHRDFRSALALAVGSKGYHPTSFADRPYPVDD